MIRRRRTRGERGQTLFEVIIVVALLGVVLTMVYEGIDSATKAIGGTEKRLANLDEARVLMAVTTKDVRTATRLQAGTAPFVLANPREVIFYANLNNNGASGSVVDNGPRQVRIYVDAGSELIEQVTKPDATSVAPRRTRTTAPRPTGTSGASSRTRPSQPIFRYFDSNGAELTAMPLSATDRLAVDSVEITLSIKGTTTFTLATTTLVNTVRLPNVDYQQTLGG